MSYIYILYICVISHPQRHHETNNLSLPCVNTSYTHTDFGCYYNECFLRGHPRLTILMKRISPGLGKSTPNAYEEPDFYLIAKQTPLHPTNEESLFSPDKFEGKEDEKVKAATAKKVESSMLTLNNFINYKEEVSSSHQEVMNLDPLPQVSNNNRNRLDSIDMTWTRVAPICMEDGLCNDPSCLDGSNDNNQQNYSEDIIPDQDSPGIPYLQSLLHSLLMYKDDDTEEICHPDSLTSHPWVASSTSTAVDSLMMPMTIPEQEDFGLNASPSSEDYLFPNSP